MNLDFTVCAGVDCPLRSNCKRYRGYVQARNDNEMYVSQFVNMPYKHGPNDELYCDSYLQMKRPNTKT